MLLYLFSLFLIITLCLIKPPSRSPLSHPLLQFKALFNITSICTLFITFKYSVPCTGHLTMLALSENSIKFPSYIKIRSFYDQNKCWPINHGLRSATLSFESTMPLILTLDKCCGGCLKLSSICCSVLFFVSGRQKNRKNAPINATVP